MLMAGKDFKIGANAQEFSVPHDAVCGNTLLATRKFQVLASVCWDESGVGMIVGIDVELLSPFALE